MKYLFSAAIILLAYACQTSKTETTNNIPVLTLKWQTDTLLTTCESVIYDKAHDVLYVANIAGDPNAKDGNGFISIVALDGKISNLKWITGMDAPKGLGIWKDKLYVADIDRIHEIDIASGKIVNSYAVEGAKFLNDVTVDDSGKVFASDSNTGTIVVLEDGKVSNWLGDIKGPNGLLSEGNTMLMVSWAGKTLNTIDVATKQITLRTDSLDNPDGIEAVGDGGHLVSSWNGMIHYVGADWKKALVLDTRTDSISAADIEYIQEKNLLLIPTFFKNRIDAYELKK